MQEKIKDEIPGRRHHELGVSATLFLHLMMTSQGLLTGGAFSSVTQNRVTGKPIVDYGGSTRATPSISLPRPTGVGKVGWNIQLALKSIWSGSENKELSTYRST